MSNIEVSFIRLKTGLVVLRPAGKHEWLAFRSNAMNKNQVLSCAIVLRLTNQHHRLFMMLRNDKKEETEMENKNHNSSSMASPAWSSVVASSFSSSSVIKVS